MQSGMQHVVSAKDFSFRKTCITWHFLAATRLKIRLNLIQVDLITAADTTSSPHHHKWCQPSIAIVNWTLFGVAPAWSYAQNIRSDIMTPESPFVASSRRGRLSEDPTLCVGFPQRPCKQLAHILLEVTAKRNPEKCPLENQPTEKC